MENLKTQETEVAFVSEVTEIVVKAKALIEEYEDLVDTHKRYDRGSTPLIAFNVKCYTKTNTVPNDLKVEAIINKLTQGDEALTQRIKEEVTEAWVSDTYNHWLSNECDYALDWLGGCTFEEGSKELGYLRLLVPYSRKWVESGNSKKDLRTRPYFIGRSGGWLVPNVELLDLDDLKDSIDDFEDVLNQDVEGLADEDILSIDSDDFKNVDSDIKDLIEWLEAFKWLRDAIKEMVDGLDFSEELEYRISENLLPDIKEELKAKDTVAFTNGAYITPRKIDGKFVWIVSSFEDDTHIDGESMDVMETADTLDELIKPYND